MKKLRVIGVFSALVGLYGLLGTLRLFSISGGR